MIAALVTGAVLAVRAGTVPELWPTNTVSLAGNALTARLADLDALAGSLPDKIKPAAQLQKIIFQINAGVAPSVWRADLQKLAAQAAEGDPLALGIRDVARVWLARAQMKEIDAALVQYYTRRVKFPGTLAELGDALPEQIRNDPWGEPWVYTMRPPRGLPKLTDQRYNLGPKKHPNLARQKSLPVPVFTKLSLHQIGENKTLEFQWLGGTAVIQPGGVAAGATLLHIGENWALLAAADRLFAVTF